MTTVQDDGSIRRQKVKVRKYLGTNATNNFAEYHGLICGLKEAKNTIATYLNSTERNETIDLHVRGDSILIIRQMQGTYQCKSANLIPLHQEAKTLVAEIKQLAPIQVSFEHVYREDNTRADGKHWWKVHSCCCILSVADSS